MVKTAVIGLGRVGSEFSLDEKRGQLASHISCYNADPRVDGIACCDIDNNKLINALKQITKTKLAFDNYKQMMAEYQPQVVSICTPTWSHAEIACAVAKFDCVTDILLEKPISTNMQEAEAINEACKGKRLRINYARRWSKLYRDTLDSATSLFDDNLLSIVGIHPGPVLRTGTHMLDLFNWAFEWKLIENIQAFGPHTAPNYLPPDIDDYCINGVISYKNGATAILLGQQMPYLQFELDLRFKDSRAIIDNNGLSKRTYCADYSDNYSKIKELQWEEHRKVPRESLLMNAIKESIDTASLRPEQTFSCPPPHTDLYPRNLPNSCPGEVGAEALFMALGLHYSATHGNCPVKLTDIKNDYCIRSW